MFSLFQYCGLLFYFIRLCNNPVFVLRIEKNDDITAITQTNTHMIIATIISQTNMLDFQNSQMLTFSILVNVGSVVLVTRPFSLTDPFD